MTVKANNDLSPKYSQSRIRRAALTPMPIENWKKRPFKYHGEPLITLLFSKPKVFMMVYDWLVTKKPSTYSWLSKEMYVLMSAAGSISTKRPFEISLFKGTLNAESFNFHHRSSENGEYFDGHFEKVWLKLRKKDLDLFTGIFKAAHNLPQKFDMDVYLKWLLPDTQINHFGVQPANHRKAKADQAASQVLLF